MICLQCRYDNPPGMNFCGNCGARLAGSSSNDPSPGEAAAIAAPVPTPTAGERRQVTVMFCDLVGSTRLSEQLDPEDLQARILQYRAAVGKVVRRYQGHIAKFLGDGILVFFGYPIGQEDAPQRAVHAGIGALEALEQLRQGDGMDPAARLDARIGIHTGLAVIGDVGQGEESEQDAIIGHTPNVAARIQELATPNSVVVSEATFRLIQNQFETAALGRHLLKGISQPILAYQVLSERTARNRLNDIGALTPLVGRVEELRSLQAAWGRTKQGQGQIMALTGEPGIGKSRLARAIKEAVANDPNAWLTECRCSPYYQNTALYPIIDLYERVVLEFTPGEALEKRLAKVEGMLAQYGVPAEEGLPLMAGLLSLPTPEHNSDENPQRQRQKLFDLLIHILVLRSQRQPVLFVVEDLHWADATTVELIGQLMAHVAPERLMTLLTYRPAFQPPWSGQEGAGQEVLSLARLPDEDAHRFIEQIAGDAAMPEELIQHLVGKTDGNPLFLEELTKMIMEAGAAEGGLSNAHEKQNLAASQIPVTLRDSLLARLDRLGPAKEVAQLGAVIGREFFFDLIQAVSGWDNEFLRQSLDQLVAADLMHRRTWISHDTFVYKHALIQEAAYETLLKSRRRQYHHRIADVLQEQFPEIRDNSPEIVARHFSSAELPSEAVPLWIKAGRHALSQSANLEAVAHFQRALDSLRDLPPSAERAQQELLTLATMTAPLIASRGYSAEAVEQTLARAAQISHEIGDNAQTFPVLWGLWAFHIVRSEFARAKEIGSQLSVLAQGQDDPDMQLEIQPVLGLNSFWTGDFAAGQRYFEQAVDMYDEERHTSHLLIYGQDARVVSLSHLSWLYWILGDPDRSLSASYEAIDRARSLSHAHSLGYALAFAAVLHQIRDEPTSALQRAEEAMAFAADQKLPIWLADGQMVHGWALARLGSVPEGLAELTTGLAAWAGMGARLWRTQQLTLLAETYHLAGRSDEALVILEDSLSLSHETGECHYAPEVYRLQARIHTESGASAEEGTAEGLLRQAITESQARSACVWEMRSSLALARLLNARGEREEACRLIAAASGLFPHDAEIPDLPAVRALHAELHDPEHALECARG